MDYEVLLASYMDAHELLKSQLTQQQKLLKRIGKSMDVGDLKSAGKDIAVIAPLAQETEQTIREIERIESGADMAEFLASGDFATQLVDACKARGIDIIGEEGSYEIFPYRLKINAAEEEVLINGKKAPGLRPVAVAAFLESGRNKLLAANFNPEKFAMELASAYDIAIAHGAVGKKLIPDTDIYLSTLYKYLVPMARFRRDYSLQSYAFDLARLYSAGEVVLPDGRGIQFGPSRNNNRAIRILDTFGNEYFLATVRFFRVS